MHCISACINSTTQPGAITVEFAVAGQPLSIHVGETTVSVPVSHEQAAKLRASVQSLLETFAAKQKAERPKRWDMMEFRLAGEKITRNSLGCPDQTCTPVFNTMIYYVHPARGQQCVTDDPGSMFSFLDDGSDQKWICTSVANVHIECALLLGRTLVIATVVAVKDICEHTHPLV